jgi:hypothetical protein
MTTIISSHRFPVAMVGFNNHISFSFFTTMLPLLFFILSSNDCHAFSISSLRNSRKTRHSFCRTRIQQKNVAPWPTFHRQHSSSVLSKVGDGDKQKDEDKVFEQMDITQEFDTEALEEMEREQPSEWMIMKEVRPMR